MNILLKFFKKETLWKELIRRESFESVEGEIEATTIWRHVFSRAPELSGFLKKREIALLKGIALKEKTPEFILGQISENRLWQRFDNVLDREPEAIIEKKVQKLPLVEDVLRRMKEKGMFTLRAK